MAVTSQVKPSASFGEVTVQGWQAAGLLKPSAIKPVITTIEQLGDERFINKIETLGSGEQPLRALEDQKRWIIIVSDPIIGTCVALMSQPRNATPTVFQVNLLEYLKMCMCNWRQQRINYKENIQSRPSTWESLIEFMTW